MVFNRIRRNMKHTSHQVHELEKYTDRMYTFQDAGLYILDIAKDGIDTFKPYKTKRHLDRDLYQFFYGVRNCANGLLFLLYALVTIIPKLILSVTDGNAPQEFETIARNTVGSLAQMLRGAIQIVASPLSLIRIPFRYFAFQGIQDEKFQDRKSIKQLVKDADDLLRSPNNEAKVSRMRFILDELQRKTIDQNNSKKQTCYKGKENIHIGVNKNTMFDHVTFFTADYYLDKNSANISLDQERSINGRLASFRACSR